jgi:undecaprenyl-diphosphatase
MNFLQAIFLGILQGLTEFLPISSSAHLVIFPYLLGWKIPSDQNFAFDVIVQLGTLISLIAYFRKDLWNIGKSMLDGIKKQKFFDSSESRLGWYVLLGSIPAGVAGLLLKSEVEDTFNSPTTAALFLFGTACLLIVAEVIGKKTKTLEEVNWKNSLWMGLFQAISIFPGISRSGSVISGGMISHFKRKDAARFSFLLAIPIMLAAGFLGFLDLLQIKELGSFLPVVLTGSFAAAFVGYLVITWMLNFINQHSLYVFSAYCILLGSLVLGINLLTPIQPVSAFSQNTKETTEIAMPASLSWMIPIINECNQKTTKHSFVYSYKVESSFDEQTISFQTNKTDDSEKIYFLVFKETFTIVVNRSNPISQLEEKQLDDIFNGRQTSWQQIITECPMCINANDNNSLPQNPIQPWVYPPGSPSQRIINDLYLNSEIISASANIAPDEGAAAEAVSINPSAVSFLPIHWLNNQVKAISIIGITENQTQSPILVGVNETEVKKFEPLIICMQKKLSS